MVQTTQKDFPDHTRTSNSIERRKWALLIGVDHYIPGDKRAIHFSHLRGCVEDVQRIERYLQTRSAGACNIVKLMAIRNDHGDEPVGDRMTWPTFENIKRAIEDIGNEVTKGDLVYIHYSGHGILRRHLGTLENPGGGDAVTGTALALTDVMAGGAYLTGYQLGVWVRKLVQFRKVRVCLVLDSCFSGSGFRANRQADFDIRTSDTDSPDEQLLKVDEAADEDARSMESELDARFGSEKEDGEYRNANLRRSWLSRPWGCTVISSCQLDQQAGESLFDPDDQYRLALKAMTLVSRGFASTKTNMFFSHGELQESNNTSIQDGDLAVMEAWAFQSSKPIVRLLGLGGCTDLESELEEALSGSLSLFADDVPRDYSFTVSINDAEQINIRDDRDPDGQDWVPNIPANDPNRARKTAHILNHMARFNALKSIDHGLLSRALSRDDFIFEPLDDSTLWRPLAKLGSGMYEARHGQIIRLLFRNIGPATNVHLAIFSFNSTRGIEKFYPEDGQPMALVYPCNTSEASFASQEHFVRLQMHIPPKANPGDSDTVDLYRAYVYQGNSPPSWDELSLPDLPNDARNITEELPVEPVLEEHSGRSDDMRNARRLPGNLSKGLDSLKVSEDPWTFLEFRIRIRA
ncbi:caspase domain-containing protein [Colletotrichum gloeosporioides Cg-14]|uniref:Caspase domain-containing protein n=1 Tax=Colletotrichum gloeosporioides (strain Cg-14) TaxID=1237896 RepID=T0KI63_COLGC|nr:caspase domain-containing protein [Colletotrichum gloeosporioides Cg-14]